MSPHPGEAPLSLIFALIPAIAAAIILIYILARLVPELIQLRRAGIPKQNPNAFRTHPDVQEQVDALYDTRRVLRETLEQHSGYSSAERRLLMERADRHIHDAVQLAHAILDDEATLDALTGAVSRLQETTPHAQSDTPMTLAQLETFLTPSTSRTPDAEDA